MRDFYVVDTAFQLICATEARAQFSAGRDSHLIIDARGGHQGRSRNLDQMKALTDDGWASVSYNIYPLSKGAKRSLVRTWLALRTRARLGRADRLFCGIASDKWVRIYQKLYAARQVIRTDDGTATLFALRDLRATDLPGSGPVRAFSIFARDDDPAFIAKNTLAQLAGRKRAGQQIRPDLVWLIGGAYSETRVLSPSAELDLFRAIRDRFEGRRLCYLPHRDDSDDKLEQLRALGLDTAAHGPNLETRLLDSPDLPADLAGIASTALFTARLLQPDLRISALRSPLIMKPGYDLVYAEAARHGIQVLDAARD